MLKYPEEVLAEKDERIKFLENLICPNGHDFQRSYRNMIFKEINFNGERKEFNIQHYYCSKCNKYKKISIHEEVY